MRDRKRDQVGITPLAVNGLFEVADSSRGVTFLRVQLYSPTRRSAFLTNTDRSLNTPRHYAKMS